MTTSLALGASAVVRTLKDGYWDRTEIVQRSDGSLCVRKSSKGDAPEGPWGIAALRREIEYLSTLPEEARTAFPALLRAWDEPPAHVGYEIPFYPEHRDAGEFAKSGALGQPEIDSYQDLLAELLLRRVHVPQAPFGPPLSEHVQEVVEHSLAALERDAELAPLINAAAVRLNGEEHAGPRAAFARAKSDQALFAELDRAPQVRLHGDFFLENTLWRRSESGDAPRLLLIDPVSVAGVSAGPPLFDLVKYESYATGELVALRASWVTTGGFDGESEYSYRVNWEQSELTPFRTLDWHRRFRRAFEAKYGAVDRRTHRLIDGYFSVAMAVNTSGTQRRARLLKATLDFDALCPR